MDHEPPDVERTFTEPSETGFRATGRITPSVIALVLANLIPLLGVLFFRWSLFSIMFLYWMESAIVGFYNIPKILMIAGVWGVPVVLFFVVHYGMFMAVHLVFIFVLFSGQSPLSSRLLAPIVFNATTVVALLSLFVSHGVSFFSNFVAKEEYAYTTVTSRYTAVSKQMGKPYVRIVIMHITILAGGFLVMLLGAPPAALAVMILLKIGADLHAHMKEHSVSGTTRTY